MAVAEINSLCILGTLWYIDTIRPTSLESISQSDSRIKRNFRNLASLNTMKLVAWSFRRVKKIDVKTKRYEGVHFLAPGLTTQYRNRTSKALLDFLFIQGPKSSDFTGLSAFFSVSNLIWCSNCMVPRVKKYALKLLHRSVAETTCGLVLSDALTNWWPLMNQLMSYGFVKVRLQINQRQLWNHIGFQNNW